MLRAKTFFSGGDEQDTDIELEVFDTESSIIHGMHPSFCEVLMSKPKLRSYPVLK